MQEVSGDSKDDAGIRAVCQRMYNTLRLAEPQSQGNSQVLLDAPIQLSKITENYDCGTNLPGLLKREQSSTVNAKKLEKAEARLKAKQEKRSEKDTLKTSSLCPWLEENQGREGKK